MASAETGLACLRVFFIQPDFLLRGFPKSDEVQDFSIFVFSDFEDDRIQPFAHPTDGQKLLRNIGPPIKPGRPGEQLPRLLEPYAPAGIRPQTAAFPGVEAKTQPM